MSAAADFEVIKHFTSRIATALNLRVEELPLDLSREQIARVARLKNGRSLASTLHKGVGRRQPRWLAFQSTIGRGIHAVPVERLARWLAIDAGVLQMPTPPAADKEDAGVASLQNAWHPASRRVHRCEG